MKKTALITGISGQDGSYLAEYLLTQNYKVFGLLRRHSNPDLQTSRIAHIRDDITWEYGDVTDAASIEKMVRLAQPDEIYHLAAQSHVRISFHMPKFTTDVNVIGTVNVLEACRTASPFCKSYQACSSEMFGNNVDEDGYQRETTLMNPVSPYGCGKLFGYNLVRNYRRAYKMFAVNGILFNHESVPSFSPVIIQDDSELIDVVPIEDLFRSTHHRYEGILEKYKGHRIWDGEKWTKILSGTCYRDLRKSLKLIQTRETCYETTDEHAIYDNEKNEIEAREIKLNTYLYKPQFPDYAAELTNDINLCKFIGFVVGNGSVSDKGTISLTGTCVEKLENIADILYKRFGWRYTMSSYAIEDFDNYISKVWKLKCQNDSQWGKWLKKEIHTRHSYQKRVPKFILNSNGNCKRAFFDGYYLANGINARLATCDYKGFTTNSPTLCLGLTLIAEQAIGQKCKVKCEIENNCRYYHCQMESPEIDRGEPLEKPLNEVIKIIDTQTEDGWFFDLQTESQMFAVGPKPGKVHNSPRRGANFVTAKIVKAARAIKEGKQSTLLLGNINTARDWGHAKDYVKAMYLMMNHKEPDDFIIASGNSYSVRDVCEYVFSRFGLDYKTFIQQGDRYVRPEDVCHLKGDASKARHILGWQPQYNFHAILDDMIENL